MFQGVKGRHAISNTIARQSIEGINLTGKFSAKSINTARKNTCPSLFQRWNSPEIYGDCGSLTRHSG